MQISLFVLLGALTCHTSDELSKKGFNRTDSVTINIKLAGTKKAALAAYDQFQRVHFVHFVNSQPDPSIVTKKIPLPANRLLYYKTYYNKRFYEDSFFVEGDDVLHFEVDSNYALKQIQPKIRNTFINHIFNIYDDFSISKGFHKYTDDELKEHYRISDSLFTANNQKNEKLYEDHLISESDFREFSNYLKHNYFFRILAPISYNFPYSKRLDPYLNPHLNSIEEGVRINSTLHEENKKIVTFLMKYYLSDMNKNANDFRTYRDVLFDKNFGHVILPILLERLDSYPTKMDLVFGETFTQLNEGTSNLYKGYVDSIRATYSKAKLKVDNVHFLSNENNQKVSLSEMLKKYRGNILVMDFWASWCIPCIQEFPSIAKLETQYADLPVKFIGISLDEDSKVSSWTNMIKKQKLRVAHQYKLEAPRRSDLTSFYRITSLPRYIVFDKQGNLINENFALPSSSEFEKELNNLLRIPISSNR